MNWKQKKPFKNLFCLSETDAGNLALANTGRDPKGPLSPDQALPVPNYHPINHKVKTVCFEVAAGQTAWYPAAMVGAEFLGAALIGNSAKYVEQAAKLLQQLIPDGYSKYLLDFYQEGLSRFGSCWRYADIVTLLIGLAEFLKPRNYLEIGVRRGRSACAVGNIAPDCRMALFDMWVKNYAGMDNPGPDLIRTELKRVEHTGQVEFIEGNSHSTLPTYFAAHPDTSFDLITVDGDHTNLGAAQDLCDVLPYLSIGGAIVFDDISHPKLLGLRDVWKRMVANDHRFSEWSFGSVGYGVAFAIRKW